MRAHVALRPTAVAVFSSVVFAFAAQAQDNGLPLGRPVDAIGSTYIAEEHGDWEIRCIRVEEDQPEPCQLYQLLVDEGGNPVAELNIFDLPDEGSVVAGATLITPLDTLLPPGVRMRVDNGPTNEYPFAFCQQIGCFARMGLTAENLQAFRAGGSAFVSIVPLPAPDQVVELEASLIGFTAGYDSLSERSAAAFSALDTPPAE